MVPVLSRRSLNRALLARQLLLRREHAGVHRTVEHLVGMQAQAAKAPYTGLWSRLVDFDPMVLSAAIEDRSLVRVAAQRGTVHLLGADDAHRLRAWTQPLYDRGRGVRTAYADAVRDIDEVDFATTVRALLAERPRTAKELGEALVTHWPGRSPSLLARFARDLVPQAQIPPRGLWLRSGQASHVTLDDWVPAPDSPVDPADVVRRYLGAFGPASVRDVQAWSGLTRLREVVEPIRGELLVFRDEQGTELFDLPDAPRPDADVPAPVRLVAEFDNLVLGHADRTRVISDRNRARMFTRNAVLPGALLVDGMVVGEWSVRRVERVAVARLTPYAPLADDAATDAAVEARALLAFLANGEEHRVVIAEPG